MRITLALGAILAACPAAAAIPVEPKTQPPAAVARPVTDDYFGTRVVYRFRYMESRDAETTAIPAGVLNLPSFLRDYEQQHPTQVAPCCSPARTSRLGPLKSA